MAYGWDERYEYEKLRRRYPTPPMVYGYSGGYPADYLRFLELQKRFDPPPDPTELYKNDLTKKAKTAEQEKKYLDAEKLWLEIAAICHRQGSLLEKDAYWVEHRAMQCRHMQVYQDARISIQAFSDIPNLDKLQDALTDAAQKSWAREDYASFTVYSLINARLCHAQGKERDAFLLEESTKVYSFFDQYFVRPGEISRNPSVEEIFLRQIAEDYDGELYLK